MQGQPVSGTTEMPAPKTQNSVLNWATQLSAACATHHHHGARRVAGANWWCTVLPSYGCCHADHYWVIAKIGLSLTPSAPSSRVDLVRWTQDAVIEAVSHDPLTCRTSPIRRKSQVDQWQTGLLEQCCPTWHGMQVCDWPHDQEVSKTFTPWSRLDYKSVGTPSKQKHGGTTLKQLFCKQSQTLASAILALSLISASIEPHHNDMVLKHCNFPEFLPVTTVTHSPGQRDVAKRPRPVKICRAPVATLPTGVGLGCCAWMLRSKHLGLPFDICQLNPSSPK